MAVGLLANSVLGQGQGTNDVIDFIHGNATNERDSGIGVTPSLAPGPWKCGASCFDDTDACGSIVELDGKGDADFANADDRGPGVEDNPNFSGPYDHGGVGQATGGP